MIPLGLDNLAAAVNPKWVTARYFTEGWGTFFKEELYTLAILNLLVGLVGFVLGHSITCTALHMAVVVVARRVMAGGFCCSSKKLDGQTIVVTGCNVGIGRATVRDLSLRGARVVMACRDTHMADKVAAEIRRETGGDLVAMKLDLASLASVRSFAAELRANIGEIHMLINNAGVMFCPYKKTEDGFEMQMGTNHLGHFLLTNLLLPLMTHSQPARIINVSSLGHAGGIIPLEDMNYEKSYNKYEAYFNSKLANILFTRQLAKKLKG
ncbi:Retinol dehydrogenase 12 [Chionoecetes opilio]|nr:Retinol dehydrogenase 12 [Chionoecetes opilio]